ncbi:RNA-binding S4 domain-containing protein [Pararhodobacter sp.]|jgi:ribosome-associated heat shock protein Hsp15|uniref:RNA-binding S4 domain-containing protein n=1 Tax=Pararhodobacter sp. TaxID=2127056 RepID=UPI002FDECD72
MDAPESGPIRLDKWLWHARFFKSRSLAAQAVGSGRMRVNSQPAAKPAVLLRPGDVLTFVQGERVRVVRIVAPGTRRGPAPEAQALYEDLSPAPPPPDLSRPQARAGGRPQGRDRRAMDALRGRDAEG